MQRFYEQTQPNIALYSPVPIIIPSVVTLRTETSKGTIDAKCYPRSMEIGLVRDITPELSENLGFKNLQQYLASLFKILPEGNYVILKDANPQFTRLLSAPKAPRMMSYS